MSLASITNAQRYNVGNAVNIAAHNTQRFINNTKAPTAAQEALIAGSMQDAADALAVAGYFALPAGTATVTDGAATAVLNSAGADSHPATAVVTDGALTGVKITADTTAIVDLNDTVEIRRADGSVTGITTGSARVAAGVLANVRLPITADAVVNNGTVSVRNYAGADAHTATAIISGAGVLTGFNLGASIAMVDNSDTLSVINSAGSNAHPAVAVVSTAGNVTGVRLAATAAMVDNGQALTVPVTGTYTTTATISVANGVVTGIVLS